MRGRFGYNAMTAKAILDRTYQYPNDFDQATKEICQECAIIRKLVLKDTLNILITKEDWRQQWRGRRESTASSESSLHFGHYIAGIKLDHIAHFHALKASLVLK
jgi:hypothetical protein